MQISFAQLTSAPVNELKQLLAENTIFKTNLLKALDNVQDLPDGSPNPWKGRSIDDLLTFIDNWFNFLPDKHSGLDKIMEFSLLYYKNPYGLKFINQEPGLSWSLEFVKQRGQFMDSPESLKAVDV